MTIWTTPFEQGWGNSSYWGGYCNHGNILFPTWHRVYLLKLEEALQSIAGCGDVMLPYWDETSDDSLKNGIPWALTQKTSCSTEKQSPIRSGRSAQTKRNRGSVTSTGDLLL
jgi:hypothetical protein